MLLDIAVGSKLFFFFFLASSIHFKLRSVTCLCRIKSICITYSLFMYLYCFINMYTRKPYMMSRVCQMLEIHIHVHRQRKTVKTLFI